jgi:hypothetical protein
MSETPQTARQAFLKIRLKLKTRRVLRDKRELRKNVKIPLQICDLSSQARAGQAGRLLAREFSKIDLKRDLGGPPDPANSLRHKIGRFV